jgi:biotin synthase-like enzyme
MGEYEHGSIITSRGCPNNCIFCASKDFFGTTYERRTIESAINEVEIIVNKYGHRVVHFCDDTFTLNHKWVKEFCSNLTKKNFDLRWSALSRCNTISESVLYSMKEAGCELIIFGVESGSQDILDRAQKNISIEQVKESVKLCQNVGIGVKTTWIAGLPGNMLEQQKSLELMKYLESDQISVSLCVPFPGTKLYHDSKNFGISINPNIPASKWWAINPSYCELNPQELEMYFRYDYASFVELFAMVDKWRTEMLRLGYEVPTVKDHTFRRKTFKSFFNRIKNPLIEPNVHTSI